MGRTGRDLDVDPTRLWPAALACSAVTLVTVMLLLVPDVRALAVGADAAWHDLLVPVRTGVAVAFSTFMYWVGDVALTTLVRVALGIVLLAQRRWYTFSAWAIAGILSPVCVEVLKHAVQRDRPADILLWASGHSFPSGHATAAATTSVMIVLAFVPARRRLPAWIAAAVWTVLMAWSRNLLAAHWLSDVVVGMLVGASVPLVVFAAVATLQRARARDGDAEAAAVLPASVPAPDPPEGPRGPSRAPE